MIDRILELPSKSFLLLGPRGTGKSTWLRQKLKAAVSLDLLKSSDYLALSQDPSRLRAMVEHLSKGQWVLIDEVQRLPQLLSEVHALYEEKKLHFALSGSSARKLRREGADLLAGRALRKQMFPLIYPEYGKDYGIKNAVEWGALPLIVTEEKYRKETLASYLDTYLKEEIVAEAVIRKLEPFVRFLQVAGLFNGQLLNLENVARDASVKRNTVENYFQILEDTLLGSRLPAYQPKLKAKELARPKFYFFDPGVARACAGVLEEIDSVWKGFAFETLLLNELKAYLHYHSKLFPISHYSIAGSYDIDFIVEIKKHSIASKGEIACIEVKYSEKFDSRWCKSLSDFSLVSKAKIRHKIIVYRGKERLTKDGVAIFPVELFLKALHSGDLF